MYTKFAQTASRFGRWPALRILGGPRLCSSAAAPVPELPAVAPPQPRPTFGENLGQFISRHPFITLGFAWWLGYGAGCNGRPLFEISLVRGTVDTRGLNPEYVDSKLDELAKWRSHKGNLNIIDVNGLRNKVDP